MSDEALGASFRDPNGFVFERDGVLLRRVNPLGIPDYERLMESGLYDALVSEGLLIAHEEIDDARADGGLTLRPERIDFVSHPYEWCFSQLRDAGLTTLRVQRLALGHGMTLKDASAYNVQFHQGRPVFIDTLSFADREEGAPWSGYRQLCEHFLAPLALVAHRDVRLSELLRVHLDGIPLDLARSLLPTRAWLSLQLLLHIRIHAGFQIRWRGREDARERARPMSAKALENLVAGLESALRGLRWEATGTEWAEYGEGDSYRASSLAHKRRLVGDFLSQLSPGCVWDLGANTGEFSRIACSLGARTVSLDIDPACVERSYRSARAAGETRLLPLIMDLRNPSPALGWAHRERASLMERRSADVVMALALVHHLAIANNVPLERVVEFFASLAADLIVEFVPKSDPKVRTLLATREDIFPDYTREGFESAFSERFELLEAAAIEDSERILYRMRRRS
jgi:hypothetical protein